MLKSCARQVSSGWFVLLLCAALCIADAHAWQGSHWAFDESRGKFALEQTSARQDLVHFVFNHARYKPSSDPYWRPGCISKGCLRFDGYSTFIKTQGLPEESAETGFTLSAWVAPHAFEWGDGGKYSAVLSQYTEVDDKKFGLVFGIHRHGSWGLRLGFGDDAVNFKVNHRRLSVDTWAHIAATFDPANHRVGLFLNGEQVGDVEVPGERQFRIAKNTQLRVGKHSMPHGVAGIFHFNTFTGLMDEVRIQPRPLSPGEIEAQYRHDLAAHNGAAPQIPDQQIMIPREVYAGDRYRPQYHLIAHAHWMNEPHAPFYFNGQYHLFYQKNPHGPFWHQIHWGHWVSDDMVHWRELPMALYPEKDNLAPDGIWSGSASYDATGKPVLFFTAGNDSTFPKERTGLALPADITDKHLVKWKKYPEPVTVQQKGWGEYGQFRDPFVWKDPQKNRWYQLVTSGIPGGSGTALLFVSDDLINWDYKGPLFSTDIGKYPQVGTIWELPVFLPVGKASDGQERYIFMFNASGHGAERDVYYWLGRWDADAFKFIPDHVEPRLFDLGKDHFTGPSGFVDPKTGRSIVFSIAQGERTPHGEWDSGWAHNGGLPIKMWLGNDDRLRLAPIEELTALRTQQLLDLSNISGAAAKQALSQIAGDMLEIELEVELATAGDQLGLVLRATPDRQEKIDLFYRANDQHFVIDRRQHSIDPDMRGKELDASPISLGEKTLKLRVFLDRSMLEAYINERKSLTSRAFPARNDALGLDFIGSDAARVLSLKVWRMGSAYGDVVPVKGEGAKVNPKSAWQSGLPNHDFASCDLAGWKSVRGSAFGSQAVTSKQKFWTNIFFNPSFTTPGGCHFWGYNGLSGDAATGEMHSRQFVLGGDGQINFLLAGGDDPDNIYIALMRAEDDKLLMKSTGVDYEEYRRVFWDASAYIGEKLYLKVVDDATEGWGHINLDDVHVPVKELLD